MRFQSLYRSYIYGFTNGTYYCILFHTMTFVLNNAFYKLVKTTFLCLSSNLSYPVDLKKQWLHRRSGSRKILIKGGLSGPPSLQIRLFIFSLSSLCSLSQSSLFSISSLPSLLALAINFLSY